MMRVSQKVLFLWTKTMPPREDTSRWSLCPVCSGPDTALFFPAAAGCGERRVRRRLRSGPGDRDIVYWGQTQTEEQKLMKLMFFP